MDILLEKNDARLNLKIPSRMGNLIKKATNDPKISVSMFVRMALKNKLEKDLDENLD